MRVRFEAKGRAALHQAIEKEAAAEVALLNLSEDEAKALVNTRVKRVLADCKLWSADGTTFTLEIDTTAATCLVVPV